jgi:hypothetical protein
MSDPERAEWGGLETILAEREARHDRALAELQAEIARDGYPAFCPGAAANSRGEMRTLCAGILERDRLEIGCPCDDDGACPFALLRFRGEMWERLAEIGFGPRYRQPSRDLLPAEYAEPIHAYLADLPARRAAGEGMCFLGGPGIGKTCALAYLAFHLDREEYSVAYYYAPALFNALHEKQEEETAWARRVDWLLIDDLGIEYNAEWVASQFDSLIEYRHGTCKPCLVTSNATPEQMQAQPHLRRILDRWREDNTTYATSAESQRGMKT